MFRLSQLLSIFSACAGMVTCSLSAYSPNDGGPASCANISNIDEQLAAITLKGHHRHHHHHCQPVGDAIIPFASGGSLEFSILGTGQPDTVGIIGFGSGVENVPLTGGNIDTAFSESFAFMMPEDGVLKAISGYFNVSSDVDFTAATVTVAIQIYTAQPNDSFFEPIAATHLSLSPVFSGFVPTGTISYGILEGLKVPLPKETRILVVFAATSTGVQLVNTIIGYASAGLAIRAGGH
jgi:BclB C-terminal domain-containing protein